MKFKIEARKVAELEEELKQGLQEIIWLADLKTTAVVLSKILEKNDKVGVSIEEAYAEIDKYLKEGNDLDSLRVLIMEEFKKMGFLNKAIDTKKIQKKYEESLKEIMNKL